MHLTLLGLTIRIDVPDRTLRAEVEALWQPCVAPVPATAPAAHLTLGRTASGWVARDGCQQLGEPGDRAAVLRVVATAINAWAVRGCTDLLVHSACVARRGVVVALAAQSGGGKSTLTAACLADGWDYVTDEALRLRRDGAVLPYAKPLALSPRSLALLGLPPAPSPDDAEVLRTAAELAARSRSEPTRLTHVVLLQRMDAPTPARLLRLHPADAFTGLVRLSFNHYVDPPTNLARLAAAVDGRSAWQLRYSDASDAAALLSHCLAGEP